MHRVFIARRYSSASQSFTVLTMERSLLNSPAAQKMKRTSDGIMSTEHISPVVLAEKLQGLRKSLGSDPRFAEEFKKESKNNTLEEFNKLRETVKEHLNNPEQFDHLPQTCVKMGGAAVAGAKMLVDNARSTRSLSKKLREDCGVEEKEILYKGLPAKGNIKECVNNIKRAREDDLIESYICFQKQIGLKMEVLKRIDLERLNKSNKFAHLSKSDDRLTRKQKEEMNKREAAQRAQLDQKNLKTPKNKRAIPLYTSPTQVQNRYVNLLVDTAMEDLEVPKKKRRSYAPIPFNIDAADDENE